ncbi:MAG: type II secretion system protein [Candidatus Omnitrophota bacterium]
MVKNKGITLLELCILIAVIAISVPPLIYVFNTALKGYVIQEKMTTANFLAQLLMEQYLSMDFYDLRKGGPSNPENCTAFNPPTGNFSTEGFGEYLFNLKIVSVNPDAADLGSSGAELPTNCSNFVKVEVQVWHQNFPDRKVKLVTLVTPARDNY